MAFDDSRAARRVRALATAQQRNFATLSDAKAVAGEPVPANMRLAIDRALNAGRRLAQLCARPAISVQTRH